MQDIHKFGLALAAVCSSLAVQASPVLAQPAGGGTAGQSLAQVPLYFERNEGQVDSRVTFLARGDGYEVFLTPDGTVLSVAGTPADKRRAVVRMTFVGARRAAAVTGREKLTGVVNYFVGRDPAGWRSNVPTYAKVHYADLYKGVDAVFYGQRQQFEYDLVVAPGTNPDVIAMQFDGADAVTVDKDGDLVLRAAGVDMRLRKPFIFQNVGGTQKQVAGGYALAESEAGSRPPRVTFSVGDYDRGQPLVIDPVLTVAYSALLGGSQSLGMTTNSGQDIAVDAFGSAYIAGLTTTTDFNVENPLQATLLGRTDAFIVKLNPSGSALVYATYFGGSAGGGTGEFEGPPATVATGVVVDADGNAYVTGHTNATDLPTVHGFQPAAGGNADGFIAKLNPAGSTLLYSSYLGGTSDDGGDSIALGPDGAAHVAGNSASNDFPVRNALQGGLAGRNDAIVMKIDTAASGPGSLLYSTYIGGPLLDGATAIAVDATGHAYVAGLASAGFPVVNGIPLAGSGLFEAFLSKVSPDGTILLYSTLLGGSDTDSANGVGLDALGHAYITGQTTSPDFRAKNAHQPTIHSYQDAFLAKIDTRATGEASLMFSTFLGGDGGEEGLALAVNGAGMSTIAGFTDAPDFPTLNGLAYTAGTAFVARFGPGGVLDFSTRLGENLYTRPNGAALDATGSIYITGEVSLSEFDGPFPVTPGAFVGNVGDGSLAAFVTKITDLSALGVATLEPSRGGNTGYVSILVRGSGFDPNTTVRLVRNGYPDIVGTVRLVSSTILSVTFDLHGALLGTYDVVTTNPAGTIVTIPGGYTVETGRPAKMWVDVVSPPLVRNGIESAFTVFYGNTGNTDALGVVLKLSGMPLQSQIRLGFETGATSLRPDLEAFRMDHLSPIVNTPDGKTMMIFLGVVPPYVTGSLTVHITTSLPITTPPATFRLTATASRPFFGSPMSASSAACMAAVGDFVLDELVDAFVMPPGAGCAKAIGEYVAESMAGFVSNAQGAYNGTLHADDVMNNFMSLLGANLKAQLACSADAVQFVFPEAELAQFILSMLSKLPDLYDTADACSADGNDASDTGDSTAVGAADPNDKVGASGAGANRFVSGTEPLPYVVFFENVPTATAPALGVVITDQLDMSKLDLNTFSLGPIGFGTTEVYPLSGAKSFDADVDLRPANNLIVRISARLDMATGLLTHRFTSLDPATGLPPTDPLAGFLPPNVHSPEGSGRVLFTVMPKAGLPSGTVIRNAARIVFDTNDPIDTPEWFNTIDNEGPASAVAPLPATSSGPVLVQWGGTDTGAGVRDYSVYVSENNGPFTPFVLHTTNTLAMLNGTVGSTYTFYSVARDLAANIEEAKTVAEATVTIVAADTTPPSIVPPPDMVVEQTRAEGAVVTYPAPQIVETGSGLASSGCLPASGSIFPVGRTTVACTATDNAGNIGNATFAVTITPLATHGSIWGAGFIEAGREKWHFTLNAGNWLPWLLIWANGPSKWFVATSMDAVFSNPVRLSGSGIWNGQAGYTFEATAADRGEPGRKDVFSFVIKNRRGAVVASAQGTLSGGNIQSKWSR